MIIYKYEKTAINRPSLDLFDADENPASQNLCVIDGWCYISVADNAVQDPDVVLTQVDLTPQIRAQIKALSTRCKLIKQRAWKMVNDVFSDEDQRALDRKMAAAGAGIIELMVTDKAVLQKYKEVNDTAMAWAADQYTALGL